VLRIAATARHSIQTTTESSCQVPSGSVVSKLSYVWEDVGFAISCHQSRSYYGVRGKIAGSAETAADKSNAVGAFSFIITADRVESEDTRKIRR
jgi:hypothetical protein